MRSAITRFRSPSKPSRCTPNMRNISPDQVTFCVRRSHFQLPILATSDLMNALGDHAVQVAIETFALHTEYAEHLTGPGDFLRAKIPLPTADPGYFRSDECARRSRGSGRHRNLRVAHRICGTSHRTR